MQPIRFVLSLAVLVALAPAAFAQGTRQGPGVGREQMWPAPTAEDWKKPVLIEFQRTWKDAVAVSQRTNRPILVCINMDGEIASEHYAGIRYRQPEAAKLYEDYVCVIASVYRHTPRDHDEQGRRILCPRFGSVTCGEHIAIEPIIFEKFCNGERVAPRHIAVDLDGKEVWDVYYANDTASVFDAIREHVPTDEERKPITIVRGDKPILERVASRHVVDRRAVEKAYREGDAELKRKLLDEARKQRAAEQLDLLRLAVFGLDTDLSRKARTALAEVETKDATELISEALRVPMEAGERTALIAALKRLGSESPLAQWLAGAHAGLAAKSSRVNVDGWNRRGGGGVYPAPKRSFGGYGRLDHVEETARDAADRPDDPEAHVELAEATLALALKAEKRYASNPRMARLAARHLFDDAKKYAEEARKLGAPAWRVETVLALATYYGGDRKGAYPHAEKAMEGLPPGDSGWNSMAVVTIFAESRWKALKAAVKAKEDYPPEWLTDLNAAYEVLLRHPLGTAGQVAWHYDLLKWLRARRRATAVLMQGLKRFKDAPELHDRLRRRLLLFGGPDGLEKRYDSLVDELGEPGRVAPFAGRASTFAAEYHRRMRRFEKSLESYLRAIAHHDRAIEADPANRPASNEAIALAHAARARVYYQLDDDDHALREILASFERSPGTAGTRDGIGITPGETAQMLLARLKERDKKEQAAKLELALAKLDQNLLRPDIGLGPRRGRGAGGRGQGPAGR